MFVCKDCHVEDCPRCLPHFSGSTGPCEGCGYMKSCYDCHCSCKLRTPYPHKTTEEAKEKLT